MLYLLKSRLKLIHCTPQLHWAFFPLFSLGKVERRAKVNYLCVYFCSDANSNPGPHGQQAKLLGTNLYHNSQATGLLGIALPYLPGQQVSLGTTLSQLPNQVFQALLYHSSRASRSARHYSTIAARPAGLTRHYSTIAPKPGLLYTTLPYLPGQQVFLGTFLPYLLGQQAFQALLYHSSQASRSASHYSTIVTSFIIHVR